jgi:hypothetical protein
MTTSEEQKYDPKHSLICCLTKAEYESVSELRIQQILRKQHIVVTGLDHEGMKFDEEGLTTLGGLEIQRTIHGVYDLLIRIHIVQNISSDQSQELNSDATSRHAYGTLLDVKEAHDTNGKILNVLDLPIAIVSSSPKGLSSDQVAFQHTLQAPMCTKWVEYPVVEMVWGLAATVGAVSYFHIDANGFGTWIDVKTGSKYWILAKPKKPLDFAAVSLFTDHYDQEDTNMHKWDLEAVLLLPGSRL